MSSDLKALVSIMAVTLSCRTQEDMDVFFATLDLCYEMPRDVSVLPDLLSALRETGTSHDEDETKIKMDLVTYIETFDDTALAEQLAAEAAHLLRDASYPASWLFFHVLIRPAAAAAMKAVYPHLSAENQSAIMQFFHEIFHRYSSKPDPENQQAIVARDITGRV